MQPDPFRPQHPFAIRQKTPSNTFDRPDLNLCSVRLAIGTEHVEQPL